MVSKLGTVYRYFVGQDALTLRTIIGSTYIKGNGIEIGALDKPMPLPENAKAQYVDRFDREGLIRQYPSLRKVKLTKVDIVEDGQQLKSIAEGSQDFVIANHFLEHCEDPIGTIKNMIRVLRVGGTLFLTIPDKRFTFDQFRKSTDFEHLLNDYKNGPSNSREGHFLDFVTGINRDLNSEEAIIEAQKLNAFDYSIHFHVWTVHDLAELVHQSKLKLKMDIDLELLMRNGEENILILKKVSTKLD